MYKIKSIIGVKKVRFTELHNAFYNVICFESPSKWMKKLMPYLLEFHYKIIWIVNHNVYVKKLSRSFKILLKSQSMNLVPIFDNKFLLHGFKRE